MELERRLTNSTDDEEEQTQAEFIVSIITQFLLFFAIAGFAATVDFTIFRQRAFSKGTAIGLFLQSVIMPFVGYLLILIVPNLEDVVIVSLMVLLSSPGGSFSNFYCSLINGDLALSVAMTSVATFLSIITLPINIFLYLGLFLADRNEENIADLVDWGVLFRTVGVVLFAIGTGLYLSFKNPDKIHLFHRVANISALSMFLIGLVVSNGDDSPLWEKPLEVILVTFIPSLIALFLGFTVAYKAGLEKPSVVAVSIEVCLQNKAISTAFALTAFTGEEQTSAVTVPVLYGIANPFVILLLATFALRNGWTYTPPGTPLCQALWNYYQPLSEDRDQNQDVVQSTKPQTIEEDAPNYTL